jgi:hypothetical protein
MSLWACLVNVSQRKCWNEWDVVFCYRNSDKEGLIIFLITSFFYLPCSVRGTSLLVPSALWHISSQYVKTMYFRTLHLLGSRIYFLILFFLYLVLFLEERERVRVCVWNIPRKTYFPERGNWSDSLNITKEISCALWRYSNQWQWKENM